MKVTKPDMSKYPQSAKAEATLREAAERIEKTKSGKSEKATELIKKANRQKLKDGLIKGGLMKGS
jgi:hypothetical protein